MPRWPRSLEKIKMWPGQVERYIPGAKMGSGYCLPRQVNSCTGAVRQIKKETATTRTGREAPMQPWQAEKPTCNQSRLKNPPATRTGRETHL
jgi:hypothetical protein